MLCVGGKNKGTGARLRWVQVQFFHFLAVSYQATSLTPPHLSFFFYLELITASTSDRDEMCRLNENAREELSTVLAAEFTLDE